ncbi:hypothetical protein [Bacillus siamensis]|uniref:hypothetical protein n=1 Tax=Bacillus siamensis TaxID=659243 RepID=UPI0006474680|nr:hypothetical protein [Bacillus siamensis]
MKWLYQYDENFIYVDAGEIEWEEGMDIPEGYTDVRPPDGLFKAKFDPENQVWKESASEEYIESLQPPPPEPSETEILAEKVANLYYLVAMGG